MESAEGEILVANQVVCDLFGLQITPDALTGSDRQQLFQLLELQHVPSPQNERRMDEQHRTSEVTRADGRVLQINCIPIRIDDTDVGRLWVASDITALRERECPGHCRTPAGRSGTKPH